MIAFILVKFPLALPWVIVQRKEGGAEMQNSTKLVRSRNCRNIGYIVIWSIVLMLGAASRISWAYAPPTYCTTATKSVMVDMPSTVSIPRNVPSGAILARGKVSNTMFYNCSRWINNSFGLAFKSDFLKNKKIGMVNDPITGQNFTVWDSGDPAIGIAIGVKANFTNGCATPQWQDIGGNPLQTDPYAVGAVCFSTWTTWQPLISGEATVLLVATGAATPVSIRGTQVLDVAKMSGMSNDYPEITPFEDHVSINIPAVSFTSSSCSTSDVHVDMGSYKQSDFKGIGTTSREVPFSIKLANCPINIRSILIQYTPINAIAGAPPGVIGLSADSTASGIALQLKDGKGRALDYNTWLWQDEYKQSLIGSLTIPLKAAYYQTETRVTPGSAIARVEFTVNYQ
ncbi:fimbrial protein [Burkholderia gladioli]|uniref:fimbrial protein n=1 Tax=Burkholderia gladioli TaxID=28095 RepID=UPI0016403FF5|nr:fimbrial protein [Burkholderia gladioli]